MLPSQRISGKSKAYNPMLESKGVTRRRLAVCSALCNSLRGSAEGGWYPSPLALKSSFVLHFLFFRVTVILLILNFYVHSSGCPSVMPVKALCFSRSDDKLCSSTLSFGFLFFFNI